MPVPTNIIDDSFTFTPRDQGLVPRDYAAHPPAYGNHGILYAAQDPQRTTAQRISLIKEREAKGQTNYAQFQVRKMVPYHQSQTNSCWSQCVTMMGDGKRRVSGFDPVPLSPASVVFPLTGGRDVGGWPTKALEYACEHGWVPQDLWPPNSINRKYNTAEAKASRELYKGQEYTDGNQDDYWAFIDYLLDVGPAATAHNWMRHAILAVDPFIDAKGQIGYFAFNSGYMRDKNGFTWLTGQRARPDEWCGLNSMVAS